MRWLQSLLVVVEKKGPTYHTPVSRHRCLFSEASPVVRSHAEAVDQDLVALLEVGVGGGQDPTHQVDPAHHGELETRVWARGYHGIFEIEVGVVNLQERKDVKVQYYLLEVPDSHTRLRKPKNQGLTIYNFMKVKVVKL